MGNEKIFAANWKLYKNPQQTRDFFASFLPLIEKNNQNAGTHGSSSATSTKKIIFFPPAVNFEATGQALKNQTSIQWGAQNCWIQKEGAFTGETSVQTVKDLGGSWILVGHSERRKLFSETLEWTGQKVKLSLELGLSPMLCIGETLEERQAGRTDEINFQQLKAGLSQITPDLKNKTLAIAYEPVWAIGTGQVATPEQVKSAHAQIKKFLTQLGFSENTPVLYGGSVKPENAKELLAIPNVDGFLVGGASLEPQSFMKIIC